ncbi:hypothetical protein HGRIS_001759 [Hohenbuehelia grisea]|uniref:Signal recognition particle subunit SRP72 n=1 Tax=Hohenbuehelia grisea TaxID=104357 RepID=A0ABR3JJ05_9AGAR
MPPKATISSVPSKATKPGRKSAQKSTPKQSIPVPERLKRLFKSLCAQIDGGHFSNAIKTCDKILRLQAGDTDALQTKLFLLLQTEQYPAALDFIAQQGKHPQYAFEQAYSLYRLQRETEAREILDGIQGHAGDGYRGVMHLEAQLNYRQGSYQEALDIYTQLLDTAETHSEEHSDIVTNLQAAQSHLDFINADYLRALDSLPSSIAGALETAPPPSQVASSAATALVSAAAPQTAATDVQGQKKVRKSRVPPGVVPGVTPPPDPERWLKKSERSTFGQGKRRRTGGGATQGSVSTDVASSSATKGAGAKNKKKR